MRRGRRGCDARRLGRAIGVWAAAAAFGVSPVPLVAQEDFRAADLDRPILVEDAQVIKFREWEMEFGGRGRLSEGGSGLTSIFEVKTGLFRNGQVGFEVEAGLEDGPGADAQAGLESFHVHVLYNLRRETWSWPAVAVRVDGGTPGAGDLGREDWSAGVKGIVTRSFDRLRLHGNGGYVFASDADGGDYWRLGVAFDYPIGLFSKAILGDVYVEIPADAGRSRVWVEIGTRWQTSNRGVLDFGIATRLDEWDAGNANVELIVGFARVFGLPGLLSVPPYPDPRLN